MRTAVPPATASPATRRVRRSSIVALAVAAALVGVTAIWGSVLNGIGAGIWMHAAPLFAAWQPRPGIALLGPLAIASVVAWKGPDVAQRLGWTRLLVASFVAAAAWGICLAVVDPEGLAGLTRGVSSPTDFLADVDRVGAPGPFLDSFTQRIDDYVVHVRGHPPALMVVLWWMRRIGLGGPAPFVGLIVAAGAAAIVAVVVTLREVVDETTARRAVPFLVLSPAAIWWVSSADAVYAGLGAAGVAAIVVATGRGALRSDVAAALGGVTLGLGLFFSYGLVLLLLIPIAVSLARRRTRPLIVAGVAMLGVGVAFTALGFSWIEGLRVTRGEYATSVAALRPYAYFLFANIAAFAIALGPAPIAGIALLRDRRVWLLAGAALAAVLLADVSGLSKGEVERIWLPFWPWVAVAATALVARARWWLAAQATVALGVQTLLGTPW
ncbi:MAG: hypothetical protein ACRDKJ_09355 [Actinomycetota bacterium]